MTRNRLRRASHAGAHPFRRALMLMLASPTVACGWSDAARGEQDRAPQTIAPPAGAPAAPEPDQEEDYLWERQGLAVYYTMPGTEWDFAISCDPARKRVEFLTQNVDERPAVPFDDIQVGDVRRRLPATFDPDGLGMVTSQIAIDDPLVTAIARGKAPLRFHNHNGSVAEIALTAVVPEFVTECQADGRKTD